MLWFCILHFKLRLAFVIIYNVAKAKSCKNQWFSDRSENCCKHRGDREHQSVEDSSSKLSFRVTALLAGCTASSWVNGAQTSQDLVQNPRTKMFIKSHVPVAWIEWGISERPLYRIPSPSESGTAPACDILPCFVSWLQLREQPSFLCYILINSLNLWFLVASLIVC